MRIDIKPDLNMTNFAIKIKKQQTQKKELMKRHMTMGVVSDPKKTLLGILQTDKTNVAQKDQIEEVKEEIEEENTLKTSLES